MRTARIDRSWNGAEKPWHVSLRRRGWWQGDCLCATFRGAFHVWLTWTLFGWTPAVWDECRDIRQAEF